MTPENAAGDVGSARPDTDPGSPSFLRLLRRATPAGLLLLFLGLLLIQEGAFSGEQYLDPRDADCLPYIRQAQEPFSVRDNPFAFRVLTPLLVRIVKKNSHGLLGWDAAWYVVTFLALYGSGLLFYRFCRRTLAISAPVAGMATLMLLSHWIYARFQLELPFFVDPLNNFLWMLALSLLFSGRWGWFYATIAVGALNKEAILLLAPLGPLFALPREGRLRARPVVGHAATALALVGLYAAYRLALGNWLGMHRYGLMTAYDQGVAGTVLNAVKGSKGISSIFQTFGFLWVFFGLALYEIRAAAGWTNRHLIASVYLLAACCFGRLFANDANRVFVMMAPLVVGLSAVYWDAGNPRRRVATVAVLLLFWLAVNNDWTQSRNLALALGVAAAVYGVARTRSVSVARLV